MNAAQKVRDRDTLEFIRAQLETNGISPSYDEIAAFLGIRSRHSVLTIVDRLVAAGLVKKLFARRRALELVQSENYHIANCNCDGCAETRYFEQLKLVKALQVSPPVAVAPKLHGLKPLTKHTKAYWLIGFPSPPNRSAALPGGGS